MDAAKIAWHRDRLDIVEHAIKKGRAKLQKYVDEYGEDAETTKAQRGWIEYLEDLASHLRQTAPDVVRAPSAAATLINAKGGDVVSACGVRLSADERRVLAVLEDWWPGRPVWTGYLTARTGVKDIRRVVDRLVVLGLAHATEMGFVCVAEDGRQVAREARDPSNRHQ